MQERFRTTLLTLLKTTVLLCSEKKKIQFTKMLESNRKTRFTGESTASFFIVHLTVNHLTCSYLPCIEDNLASTPISTIYTNV